MQLNTKIKGNDELYSNDIDLIPLNIDAVQQRIEYFKNKVKDNLRTQDLNKYIVARDFWEEMKDKHCVQESRFEREYLRSDREVDEDVCTYPKCSCPFDMGAELKCFVGKKVHNKLEV